MAEPTVLLADDQLDRLAALLAVHLAPRVAAQLVTAKPPATPHLVDAATLADALGVHRDFVYEHADRLGVLRLGEGSRARLRFDLNTARAALAPSEPPAADTPATGQRPRRRAQRTPRAGSILRHRPTSADARRAT